MLYVLQPAYGAPAVPRTPVSLRIMRGTLRYAQACLTPVQATAQPRAPSGNGCGHAPTATVPNATHVTQRAFVSSTYGLVQAVVTTCGLEKPGALEGVFEVLGATHLGSSRLSLRQPIGFEGKRFVPMRGWDPQGVTQAARLPLEVLPRKDQQGQRLVEESGTVLSSSKAARCYRLA